MKRITDVPYVCLLLFLFGCSGDPDDRQLSSTDTFQTSQSVPTSLGLTTLSADVGAAEIARRQTAIRSYFDARVASLHAVKTTQTSDGTIIDWITPTEPRVAPPPPLEPCAQGCATTALQNEPAARGPAGTVPIVRFNVEAYLHSTAVPPLNPEDVLRSALISGDRHGSMRVSTRYGSSDKLIVAILHFLPTTRASLADKAKRLRKRDETR